jgi:hypothetical protein
MSSLLEGLLDLRLRRVIFSRNAKVIYLGLLIGVSYVAIDAGILPRIKDGTSPLQSLGLIAVICFLFSVSMLICGAVLLLKQRWISALCFLIAGFMGPGSQYVSLALKGDRFTFTAGPHNDIAAIYLSRQSDFEQNNVSPRLFELGHECDPPSGCQCWIVVDRAHTSGVEREIGRWHRPAASIFPMDTFSRHFEIVNVRRLDADAYSVLGCEMDMTVPW